MHHPFRVLLALALVATAGCSPPADVPPPTEMAESIEAVHDWVMENESALKEGNPARQLATLDATLDLIAHRYGEKSVEMTQAVRDTGLMLIGNDRYDLAEPYIQEALLLSRQVFGHDHRETGYALHDLAVVRDKLRPETFSIAAEPLLVEAIAVRRRVLGLEHLETAGSEAALSKLLLASWRRTSRDDPHSELLTQADQLAAHSLQVLERAYGNDQSEVRDLRYRQVDIALAKQEYARAESQAQDLIVKHRQPCNDIGSPQSAQQLRIAALRGAGRDADADTAEAARAKDECSPIALLPETMRAILEKAERRSL